ncbi:aldehyde dehydrogenase family protein [Amycolatopsis anabasis]|uniref:aldehyde dehydrogenase family protein n=1 Tax=Amycolatopsis anabasis TaxID=1840409 RepID=UPI00131C713C|nr:aldehyde dehydrogenase family protein [Amycolatopsis anabasis]
MNERDTSQERIGVEDPATGAVFAEVPVCSPAELDRTAGAAAAAAPGWARLSLQDRRKALLACGRTLAAHRDELAGLLTREQGKPLRGALGEIGLAADWFGHTAELGLEPERLVDEPGAEITLERVPHGVVAALAPFNFPIILAVTKLAPALLAGNTAILKPSPLTPLSSLRMVELLREVLPPGVLAAVTGGAGPGAALCAHPAVRLISFTGSIPVGREIARHAAAEFKRVVLELGGNDPAIVLPGADVDGIADALFDRALENSGQFCAAIKRIYVSHAQRADLVDALAARARNTVVGPGAEPATDLGPLAGRAQRDRVHELVTEARRAGARVVTGGRLPAGPGYFYPPTVVTDLPEGTRLETTEQFGPVIPVLGYSTVDEAVARANATEFGLGASVWGDERNARGVADALDCGTVWINTHGDLRPTVPFGGARCSGTGVEYGYWGLLEYTRIKVRNVRG